MKQKLHHILDVIKEEAAANSKLAVYIGITNDPRQRFQQHRRTGKDYSRAYVLATTDNKHDISILEYDSICEVAKFLPRNRIVNKAAGGCSKMSDEENFLYVLFFDKGWSLSSSCYGNMTDTARMMLAGVGALAPRPNMDAFDLPKIDRYLNVRALMRMLGYRFRNEAKIEARTKEFKCDKCTVKYRSQKGLREHKLQVHEGIVKPRSDPCSQCGKTFKDFSKLRRHMKDVHNIDHKSEAMKDLEMEKAFKHNKKCPSCGKIQISRKALTEHINQVHRDPNNFPKCPHCSRFFLVKQNLNQHLWKCNKAPKL
jgi:uncharacterized C2H2 Zn-finger protein